MTIKDEKGITLVELLAALSILSVVILLAGSIHMFGQRHFINQTESASHANDLSYALTVMTSDLRREKPGNIDVKNNVIEVVDKDITYSVSNNKLYKNESVIVDSVSHMKAEYDGTTGIEVTLYSSTKNTPQKEYETTITLRGLSDEYQD